MVEADENTDMIYDAYACQYPASRAAAKKAHKSQYFTLLSEHARSIAASVIRLRVVM